MMALQLTSACPSPMSVYTIGLMEYHQAPALYVVMNTSLCISLVILFSFVRLRVCSCNHHV